MQYINIFTDQTVYEHVVMKLTQGYLWKGINVNTDNNFTLAKLYQKLRANSTSLDGTFRKHRREVSTNGQDREAKIVHYIKKDYDITITLHEGNKK